MGSYCTLYLLLFTITVFSIVFSYSLIISNCEYHTNDIHLILSYESYWVDICDVGECNVFSL